MKCLTWFLCLLAASVIWTILDINGYARFIETLAVYSFFIFIADQICKRIDAKAEAKKAGYTKCLKCWLKIPL